MPRRPSTTDPELLAHQQWLGYLQPVGLVVAPAAMQDAGWVVARSGSELIERQQRYRDGLEPLGGDDDDADERELGFTGIETLLVEQLGWGTDQVQSDQKLIEGYTRELPELGETLQPTAVVPVASGEGAQLLVQELPLLTPLDQKLTAGEHLWRASPQERFERLLRETGVEAGLLFNGAQLRLVVAPKGESSGYLTFPLADLAEVSGRLMFSGLDLLLGQSHVFLDPDGYRLSDVLKKSRSFQAVVSNALADQVLAALWDLLRGFQQADELSQRQDIELLGDLPERDAQQLYGGLITMLMRLVFLLYAEDEALMPSDAVYEQNYKLSGIYEQLQQDESEYPDTMEQRFGAWAGLMSLCRLVFDGGGPTADYLPARHGQLFDPAVYPWLESPWISDGVVLALLRNLLIVNGERISYRALDVEQIGSVYEGIMGYAVRRIPGRCIGLKSKPQGAKKQLTTAVDLELLLKLQGSERAKLLEEEASTTLPDKAASALKAANSEGELLEALSTRIDHELFDGAQAAGSLVFQPTEERRRSGSHYTPRSLTRPIVAEALRPWLECCKSEPTAEQILALKICDPAMGSGAFLVESCRLLAELLERAWAREGLPEALKPGGPAHGEEPLLYARRLIAQRCLYGVDKNSFAVNLARLSLWLVSLSKDAPFTFVDHSLKCGDSLVGMERSEIEGALKGASLQRELQMAYFDQVRQQEARSFELFHSDSRSDADDTQKRQALEDLNASTAYLRVVGDLLVAAFFNGKKPKDRSDLREQYLSATITHGSVESLRQGTVKFISGLTGLDQEIRPLHWQLAFPDVFGRENPGFDVLVGNPPFLGSARVSETREGPAYLEWLKYMLSETTEQVDLCAFFFVRAFDVLREGGAMGMVATCAISRGGSRVISLVKIIKGNGIIYSAIPDFTWPGLASIVVSVIHILKTSTNSNHLPQSRLNGVFVKSINSSLRAGQELEEPRPLIQNQNRAFLGVYSGGKGFGLGKKEADAYKASDPSCEAVIHKFIGGEEINTYMEEPDFKYVINFGSMSLDEALRWPQLVSRLEQLIKPEREKAKDHGPGKHGKKYWWQHILRRDPMFDAIKQSKRCLALSMVSTYHSVDFAESSCFFSNTAVAIALSDFSSFAILQSSVHEIWASATGTRLGYARRYAIEAVFETFPFPRAAQSSSPLSLEQKKHVCATESAGELYCRLRSHLISGKREGLTSLYGRLHNPVEESPEILELRRLHSAMDQAVLIAYGWSDVPTDCGFALDHLDTAEDAQLPDELQKRIDSGELFFWNANDAIDFRGQLQAYGAIASRRKLPWRYRWPDAVRDDVLARLLALNAERYAEEVAQGLHNKGAKQAAKAGGGAVAGKRRGRPPKAAQPGETGPMQAEQMGFGL